jgi:hypothetical protein
VHREKDLDDSVVRAVRAPPCLLEVVVMDGELVQPEQNLEGYGDGA